VAGACYIKTDLNFADNEPARATDIELIGFNTEHSGQRILGEGIVGVFLGTDVSLVECNNVMEEG
jgi:hypothetical protein